MLILEAEILELHLDLVQTEPVGEGSIDVERLTGNLILLVGCHVLKGAHIVQAVGYLDEDDTDILRHGEEQLLEVFGLCRCLVAKDATRNLGEPIDNLCYFGAEEVGNVLYGILSVLNHIVQ